jgi:hypothetical protein
VQEQDHLGDLPAAFYLQNILQLHQHIQVILRTNNLALWKIIKNYLFFLILKILLLYAQLHHKIMPFIMPFIHYAIHSLCHSFIMPFIHLLFFLSIQTLSIKPTGYGTCHNINLL